MQASTRIGIALCVLVAGATLAGLFRKLPEPVVSPADRAENQLALRQPSEAPVMAATAAATPWRSASTETPKNTEARRSQGRPSLAGIRMADKGSGATSLPVPTMPEVASGDPMARGFSSNAASGDFWNAGTFRPAIPLALGPDRSSQAHTGAAAADDDWQLHEVADGDTLAKLAERYYGDAALAEAIQRANPALLKNADVLPIGAFLKIPSRGAAAPATTGRALPAEGWRQAPAARP